MTDRTIVRRLLEPTPETEAESARASRIHARQQAAVLERCLEDEAHEISVQRAMLLYICMQACRREAS